jgi:hypothetical protein
VGIGVIKTRLRIHKFLIHDSIAIVVLAIANVFRKRAVCPALCSASLRTGARRDGSVGVYRVHIGHSAALGQ